MPAESPEITRTMELLRGGQASSALKSIADCLTASLKEGKKPEPDVWACFVFALFCQGDISHGCTYAERFEELDTCN